MPLDKATSSLDPVNEAAVQEALRQLTRGKTLIVVVHRLQTVRAVDRILMLGHGRVKEQGTQEDLLAQEGRYAAFWNERSRLAAQALDNRPGNPLPRVGIRRAFLCQRPMLGVRPDLLLGGPSGIMRAPATAEVLGRH